MRGENVVSADNHLMHVRRKEGEQMCELTHEFAQSVGHANILVMQIFPPNDRVGVGGAGPRPRAVCSGGQKAYVDTDGASLDEKPVGGCQCKIETS